MIYNPVVSFDLRCQSGICTRQYTAASAIWPIKHEKFGRGTNIA